MNYSLIKKIFLPNHILMTCFRENGIKYTNLKERECWNCRKKLEFLEFIEMYQNSDISYYLELWQNDNIELFCCHCYKDKKNEKPSKYICPGHLFVQ